LTKHYIFKRATDTARLIAFFLLTSLLGCAFAAAASSGPLTPQERRGKQIYLRGSSPSGKEIKAILGDASMEVPGSMLTCVSCHGHDGRGRSEGGVTPSNITWEYLTKPYGLTHITGRKRPPYTDSSLGLAIMAGLDSAGNELLAAMPRYRMSREDLADLIAYLKRLGEDYDPGLSETSIRVGTILPSTGPMREMGQAMKAMMMAYFDEVNKQGGIFNRKIELRVTESGLSPTATITNAKHLIEEDQVFAIVGAFSAGADKEIASLMESEEVPLVGPFTSLPQISFPLNRHVFYLFSGLKEQSRVLLSFAAQKLKLQGPRVTIVYPRTKITGEIAEVVMEQCSKFGWAAAKIDYSRDRFEAAQMARELSQEKTDILFFLGSSAEQRALLKEAERVNWMPYIFLPGPLAGRDILDSPPSFKDRIFLAYPAAPSDQTRAGAVEYRALVEKHDLPAQHTPAQISAYCAAKILVEGLKLAGRDVSREKLMTALEGLYEFDTGLTQRISYGPNRRIGALGAYIVSVDIDRKGFIPVSEWITLN